MLFSIGIDPRSVGVPPPVALPLLARFARSIVATLAAGSALAAGPARAPGSPAAAATPTPRILLRAPADVPAGKENEVLAAVVAAIREAGAATVTAADFARVVEGRADVRNVLSGAREKAKTGIELDKQSQHADAVRSLEGAIEDFEFIGADVWLPDEVGKVYISLGFARWHRDVAQKQKKPSKPTVAAWRRGRELVPDFIPRVPDFAATDIAAMKKVAGGRPAPPDKPGEGLFSLGRLLGLDGVVEVKRVRSGALRIRAHKIEATKVREFGVASKGKLLDKPARLALAKGFAFPGGPLPPLVAAAATPAPSPAATATPTAIAAASPTPAPIATPAPNPSPSPTAIAMATPRPTPRSTPRPPPRVVPTPEPTPTPVVVDPSLPLEPEPGPPSMFSGSYAQLLGGADHRAALYTTESAFASAPSGTSPAGWLHVWYVFRDVWAVSGGAGGMQRVYEIDEEGTTKSATSQEAWLHVLRSDDARGRWWIGAGAAYVSEPRVTGPGGFPEVPQIARITPGAVGVAHFPLGGRFELRGRAVAGIALESGKSTVTADRAGVGYDVRVEGSAAFALSRRIRLAAGVAGQRVFTDFGEKTTAVEARRGFWLGLEAGF